MKIPDGSNMGFSTPDVQRAPDLSPITNATDRLGRIVQQIGVQEDDKQQELARAKDNGAYQDHQLAVDQLKTQYTQKIASGEIPYDQAQKSFAEDAAKIPVPKPQARGQVAAEGLKQGVNMTIAKANEHIGLIVDAARDKDLQSQGALQLDTLGKRAGLPGADIDSINSQADALAPLLRSSGLNEAQVARTLQDFKDHNWFNQATQTAMQSRTSLPALKAMEHDLTAADGFYAGKMDTDKRNAVLGQVITHRIQLENRLQSQSDHREALAERGMNQMEAQISRGIPATPDMWANLEETVRGTSFEPDFKSMVGQEQEVQQVLRLPVADQIKYVQDKQAAIDHGGTMRDAANVARLSEAVKNNVALMQNAPLVFQANRTNQQVSPIDVTQLLQPGAAESLVPQFQSRAASIQGMQKQYGSQIPMRPLLPEEVGTLTSVLNQTTPQQAAQVFGTLRQAAGSDDVYKGMMAQIAPDSPVRSLAGLLASRQAKITLQNNWFGADVTAPSVDVAGTLIAGEQLLDPTKAAKAQDGKPRQQLYLPNSDQLQTEFKNAVGTAFANRSGGAQNAFQAVQAYYVGRAAQLGRLASDKQDIDPDILRESIKATLGEVVDYNGNGQVITPWGWDRSKFQNGIQSAFNQAVKDRRVDPVYNGQFGNLALRNAGDSTYYVTDGRKFVYGTDKRPLILDLNPQKQ
ncbi:MAG: hypothetical protein RL684_3317 [Pseudomonadota bacterium]|jgi:hypothetical protein